ncbi:unnamed protein product [Eruca vesicaria subsp. sativa]|uniref:Uncharacterized protein n=1 Tax=Eruca vesicaria subsp. sativa TaxID=29727 RepID=A0ABC8KBL3_ERUVS|nr:unnamed protein product [Eruca vesicaria subsp. sativa]
MKGRESHAIVVAMESVALLKEEDEDEESSASESLSTTKSRSHSLPEKKTPHKRRISKPKRVRTGQRLQT